MPRWAIVIEGAELYSHNLAYRFNSIFSLLLRRLLGGGLEQGFRWFFFLLQHFVFTSFAKLMESRAALNYLKPAQGESICDLGCGGGVNDVLLSLPGAKVFGVDIDRGSVFQARRRASSLGVHVDYAVAELGPSQFLCFKSGSFDKAVSYCVLEHLKNPAKFLAEVNRVLRPGGVLVLSMDSFSKPDASKDLRDAHRRICHVEEYYGLADAKRLLAGSGFRVRRSGFLLASPIAAWLFERLLRSYFRSEVSGKSLALALLKLSAPIAFSAATLGDSLHRRWHPNWNTGYWLVVMAQKSSIWPCSGYYQLCSL
jgi:SAM-dependent methyltransferase